MSQTRSQNKTATKQNDIHSYKKPRVFADEPSSAKETFLARFHREFALLASFHCLLYFLAFDWRISAVLFFLNWKAYLFVKESPI